MNNYRFRLSFLLCWILLSSTAFAVPKPVIRVYPAPNGEPLSDLYKVSISGQSASVYIVKVALKDAKLRFKAIDDSRHSAGYYDTAAFAYFDIQGKATVTVSVPDEVTSAKVLPASLAIQPQLHEHSITFPVTSGQNLTIEINGEYVRSLHLFANPIEQNIPDAKDPKVIFFGPGIHEVSHLVIHDHQTVYLAGGAIIRAIIKPDEPYTVNSKDSLRNYAAATFELHGHHIRFCGRGIIDGSACPTHARNLMTVRGCSDVKIEGIILRDASTWNMPVRQCDSVDIDHVKILGYRANSDGIDICNSRNVSVKNCFLRTMDDLVVIKADKGQGNSENILVKNCVLWNQAAHALSVGAELREPVSNVLFTDCDIIHDTGREWSLRIYQCDAAMISQIRFENIRIEEAHKCISLWIGKAVWSRDKEYGHIQNVIFKNITAAGRPLTVELVGADDQHLVDNVVFDHVILNNSPVSSNQINANASVKNIRFNP